MERERAKVKPHDSPAAQLVETNGHRTPQGSSSAAHRANGLTTDFTSRSRPIGAVRDTARSFTDDTDSLTGDTLNAGGSASSHASTASSVFSAPSRPTASGAMSGHHSRLTPPTSITSPSSYLSATAHAKAQSTTPHRTAGADGPAPMPTGYAHQNTSAVDRVPAREPSRSIKAIKCIYDPLLDASLSSSERRKAKPRYKEFGLVCTSLTLRGERHLDCESIG